MSQTSVMCLYLSRLPVRISRVYCVYISRDSRCGWAKHLYCIYISRDFRWGLTEHLYCVFITRASRWGRSKHLYFDYIFQYDQWKWWHTIGIFPFLWCYIIPIHSCNSVEQNRLFRIHLYRTDYAIFILHCFVAYLDTWILGVASKQLRLLHGRVGDSTTL